MRGGAPSPEGAFPLETVEAWMQAVIVHADGATEGLRSPEARALVPEERSGDLVREAGGLSAGERLEIYAGMYPLRMREALEADYPVVARLLGPRAFGRLVRDFVASHPSTSFTLARLGDPLPGFLRGWGPRGRRSLVADVARLELAATRVFDAFDAEEDPIRAADLADVLPADLPSLSFRPVPALEVVRVRPGAVGALDSFVEGTLLPEGPGRGTVFVVFHRRHGEVLRRSVDPFAGRLLERLVAGGSLGEALAGASRDRRGRARPAPEKVSVWFREWVDLGFFLEEAETQP
jgi:hypothetical protein